MNARNWVPFLNNPIHRHAAMPGTRGRRVRLWAGCPIPSRSAGWGTTFIVCGLLAALSPAASADPPCVNWSDVSPIGSRDQHAMAYDAGRGVTVLFGGRDSGGNYLNDTWEWDGVTWTRRRPATSPPARYGHAMAYDSARGVTVLFGGYNGNGNLGDTWEWDGTNWTQRSPATSPSGRYKHAMAYDSVRGVTVLFGGNNAGIYLGDTWEWNGTTWTQRTPLRAYPNNPAHR